MFESGYIEDGYTRKGFVLGLSNAYPDLRFEYRPMLYVERRKIMARFEQPGQELAAIKAIVPRLQKWDLMKPMRGDKKEIIGEVVVEITDKEVAQVHPDLLYAIFAIICGSTASDTDPQWPKGEKQENEDNEYEAALAGTGPGIEREETDSKNSGAG